MPLMAAALAVPVLDGVDHQVGELVRGRGRDRLGELLGLGLPEHLERRRLDLVDDVGPHHRALVGDPGDHHRHLQRSGLHLELADGRLAGLRRVRPLGVVGHRLRAELVEVLLVEAERLGLLEHLVRAELDAELGERGVARVAHRLLERDRVDAAVAALVVDQAGAAAGLRQLVGRAARHLVGGLVVAVLDRRRGGHQLERRARRQRGPDRPVDQRLVLGLVEPLVGRRAPTGSRARPARWGRTTAATAIARILPVSGSIATTEASTRPAARRAPRARRTRRPGRPGRW